MTDDMDTRLSDEEVAAVVQRAHEIQFLQERIGEGPSGIEQYVKVAEELGVSREAMLQALGERFVFLGGEIEVGAIVLAPSDDAREYPAKVVSTDGDSVLVRFLNGGEGRVGRHHLREATFSPGTEYEYYSPMSFMYVRGRVTRLDRDALTATFNTWGIEETVPLAKVRTPRQRARLAPVWINYVLAAAVSGSIAALVTWLVLRQ